MNNIANLNWSNVHCDDLTNLPPYSLPSKPGEYALTFFCYAAVYNVHNRTNETSVSVMARLGYSLSYK